MGLVGIKLLLKLSIFGKIYRPKCQNFKLSPMKLVET